MVTQNDLCPCGSTKMFKECCAPLIEGVVQPETAEQLLRSRYSAYVLNNVDYIMHTTSKDQPHKMSAEEVERWSKNSTWEKLEITSVAGGSAADDRGEIEFVATYVFKDERHAHHEKAIFTREEGRWSFYDGIPLPPKQVVREEPKTGRNDPCPCGSGKKFKKCCGGK